MPIRNGETNGGAVDSPACVGSDGGFAFAVPAGDAQARTGLIGGDQAVVFPAATGAELTGVCRGGQWCVRGLFGTDPKREASGAPVALEVGVFNRAIEVALLINLSACLDPEEHPPGQVTNKTPGSCSGNFSVALTRSSAAGFGCVDSFVSLSSFTAPPASKWSPDRASTGCASF
jgi:hypothetical protein